MSGWWDPLQELASPFTLLLTGLLILFALAFVSARRRWSRAHGHAHGQPSRLIHQPFERGFDLLLDEHWPDAMQVLAETVKADPDRVLEYLELAKLFRRRGDPSRAARMFQHLLARPRLDSSLHVIAHYELGLAYRAMGLHESAAAALEYVLSVDPLNGGARRELRRTHEELGWWGKAVAVEKIRLKRGEATDYRTLAALRTQQGQSSWAAGELRQSAAHFQAALVLDPHCTEAALQLGRLRRHQGEVRKAFRIWEGLARLAPEYLHLAFRDMHAAFQQLHHEVGWEIFLRAFTERHPEDPAGHLALAEWYDSQSRHAEAEASLRRVLEVDPTCQEAHLTLVDLYRKQGAPTEVLAAYEIVVRALSRFHRPRFRCRACRYTAAEPFWKCSSCHAWGTIERLLPPPEGRLSAAVEISRPSSRHSMGASAPIAIASGDTSAHPPGARMDRSAENDC